MTVLEALDWLLDNKREIVLSTYTDFGLVVRYRGANCESRHAQRTMALIEVVSQAQFVERAHSKRSTGDAVE